jgi:hypothetical protein
MDDGNVAESRSSEGGHQRQYPLDFVEKQASFSL